MKHDIKVKLDSFELKLLVKALNEMRNDFINKKYTTQDIDELLLKIIEKYEKLNK